MESGRHRKYVRMPFPRRPSAKSLIPHPTYLQVTCISQCPICQLSGLVGQTDSWWTSLLLPLVANDILHFLESI